jgi:hypothetical protein
VSGLIYSFVASAWTNYNDSSHCTELILKPAHDGFISSHPQGLRQAEHPGAVKVSMSSPPPLPSCNLHAYIPMPEHCMTCSQIVLNLGIGEIQIPDSFFSGTYSSLNSVRPYQPTHVPLGPTASTNAGTVTFVPYSHDDSYTDRFALEEHERTQNEEEDADDYPERFALEDHERLNTVDADEYPERFALSPVENDKETIAIDKDDDYSDRFVLSPVKKRHPRHSKAATKGKGVNKRVPAKRRPRIIQKSVQ